MDADEIKETVEDGINIANAMVENMLNHPTLIVNTAKFAKKSLDALVFEGFKRSEAISILSSGNFLGRK